MSIRAMYIFISGFIHLGGIGEKPCAEHRESHGSVCVITINKVF